MDCLGICLFDLFSEPQKSKQADATPDHLVATALSIMDTVNRNIGVKFKIEYLRTEMS